MRDIVLLLVAIAFEVAATTLLKGSNGLTRLWHVVGLGICYLVAFYLMSQVLKQLPVGAVYAAWAGLGTAGVAFIGVTVFDERLPAGAWTGIGLIVVGVVLLGLYAPHGS